MSEVTYSPAQTGGTESTVAGKAQEVTSQAQEKAEELKRMAGSRVREQVDGRSTQAGEQMSSVAAALRKTGQQLRGEGNDTPAKYVEQAGERIERLGSYLTRVDSDQVLRDVEDFGRRRPWAVALAGGAAGLLAARFLKASSRRRYEDSSGSGDGTRRGATPSVAPHQEL